MERTGPRRLSRMYLVRGEAHFHQMPRRASETTAVARTRRPIMIKIERQKPASRQTAFPGNAFGPERAWMTGTPKAFPRPVIIWVGHAVIDRGVFDAGGRKRHTRHRPATNTLLMIEKRINQLRFDPETRNPCADADAFLRIMKVGVFPYRRIRPDGNGERRRIIRPETIFELDRKIVDLQTRRVMRAVAPGITIGRQHVERKMIGEGVFSQGELLKAVRAVVFLMAIGASGVELAMRRDSADVRLDAP